MRTEMNSWSACMHVHHTHNHQNISLCHCVIVVQAAVTLIYQSLQVYAFARIFTINTVYGIAIHFTGFPASFVGSLWIVFFPIIPMEKQAINFPKLMCTVRQVWIESWTLQIFMEWWYKIRKMTQKYWNLRLFVLKLVSLAWRLWYTVKSYLATLSDAVLIEHKDGRNAWQK